MNLRQAAMLNKHLYSGLLWLYPAEFRLEYGQELFLIFGERYSEECDQNRPFWRLRFWFEVVTDVFTVAAIQHLEMLQQDLRYAWRLLRRSPGFAVTAILTIALGIGANTAIFSVINALLLKGTVVSDSERVVQLYSEMANIPGGEFSYPNFKDLQEHNPAFRALAGYQFVLMGLEYSRGTDRVFGELVSANYFSLLGVQAAYGRVFMNDEDRPGSVPVVVLSYNCWQRLGGNPQIIGRTVRLNQAPFSVIGIAPVGFQGTDVGLSPDFWLPLMEHPQIKSRKALADRQGNWLKVIGRLQQGISVGEAAAALKTEGQWLVQTYPQENRGLSFTLLPLAQSRLKLISNGGDLNLVSGLLLAVAALVLLIACTNVANLLLARSAAREREIAVRLALGAAQGRLVRQLMTESLLLAGLGSGIGLFLALLGSRWFSTFAAADGVSLVLDTSLDGRMLAFCLVTTLLSSLLFGLAPALASLGSNMVASLKTQVSGLSLRRFSLRQFLVIAQVALSVILLVSTGLFVRALQQIQNHSLGYEPDQNLTMTIDLRMAGYNREQGKLLPNRLLQRIRTLPGVESASLARLLPVGYRRETQRISIPGLPEQTVPSIVDVNIVTPGYLQTMAIKRIAGRDLLENDDEDAPPVALVNQKAAQRFWPGTDPTGQTLLLDGRPCRIVGVFADFVMDWTFGAKPEPLLLLPFAQNYRSEFNLQVRAKGDPMALLSAVRQNIQTVDSRLPIFDARTLRRHLEISLGPAHTAALFLGTFGLLATLLAAVGIYGLMTYTVSQRRRELGIRLALGSPQGAVLMLVISQGMVLVLLGVLTGLLGSLVLGQVLQHFLYGTNLLDPLTFSIAPLILIVTALVACGLPAIKATRIDPLLALRCD